MRALFIVLATLMLGGCDKIQGLVDTKSSDAKAVGYSCRMARKPPNECMAENPKQPQSHILAGWKKADEDIKEGLADPEMKNQYPDEATPEESAD